MTFWLPEPGNRLYRPDQWDELVAWAPRLQAAGVSAVIVAYNPWITHPDRPASFEPLSPFVTALRAQQILFVPMLTGPGWGSAWLKIGVAADESPAETHHQTYCLSSGAALWEHWSQVLSAVEKAYAPRYVHISHDELAAIGLDERCRNRRLSANEVRLLKLPPERKGTAFGNAELFALHVHEVHGLVRRHLPGARVLMWSDMLCDHNGADYGNGLLAGGTDTQDALASLPKDIIIQQWWTGYWAKQYGETLIPQTIGRDFERRVDYLDKRVKRFIAGGHAVLLSNTTPDDAHVYSLWLAKKSPALQGVVGLSATPWAVAEQGFRSDEVSNQINRLVELSRQLTGARLSHRRRLGDPAATRHPMPSLSRFWSRERGKGGIAVSGTRARAGRPTRQSATRSGIASH